MTLVFADTVYRSALLNRRDELHNRVNQVSQTFRNLEIVTSELVLIEFLNGYSGRGEQSRKTASNTARSLRRSTGVVIEPLTCEFFDAAPEFCSQRPDQAWSMTDCSCFIIMQKYGIDSALTFDRHFEQAGFKALLR